MNEMFTNDTKQRHEQENTIETNQNEHPSKRSSLILAVVQRNEE